jgi:hypothetical protein
MAWEIFHGRRSNPIYPLAAPWIASSLRSSQ